MRFGVARALEDEADAILSRSMAGITRQADKADILTPWKEAQRKRREIYVASGVPDPAIRKGMYHRRANPAQPHLNSRDGVAAVPTRGSSSGRMNGSTLADFVAQHLEGGAS
jgi:hypothetical protein